MASYRSTVLANDQFYHIFNRGVEKRTIFEYKRDYERAINTIKFYRFKNLPLKFSKFLIKPKENKFELYKKIEKNGELIEIIAYCLIPNHFHLLVKQLQENGISKALSNFTNSYAKYFNTRNNRNGPLFQGIFKAVRVESNEQLLHLSRYIHLNPVVSFVIKEENFEDFAWSSLKEYLNNSIEGFCKKDYILDQFKSINEYKKFIKDHISFAKEHEKIKHLTFED